MRTLEWGGEDEVAFSRRHLMTDNNKLHKMAAPMGEIKMADVVQSHGIPEPQLLSLIEAHQEDNTTKVGSGEKNSRGA